MIDRVLPFLAGLLLAAAVTSRLGPTTAAPPTASRSHPTSRGFEEPTTGAIANGALYVIANSQLGRIDREGKLLVPVSELRPVAILRTELRW